MSLHDYSLKGKLYKNIQQLLHILSKMHTRMRGEKRDFPSINLRVTRTSNRAPDKTNVSIPDYRRR